MNNSCRIGSVSAIVLSIVPKFENAATYKEVPSYTTTNINTVTIKAVSLFMLLPLTFTFQFSFLMHKSIGKNTMYVILQVAKSAKVKANVKNLFLSNSSDKTAPNIKNISPNSTASLLQLPYIKHISGRHIIENKIILNLPDILRAK